MRLRLLDRFESLFRNTIYNHRVSTNGDYVAYELYEDLLDLGRSNLLSRRIEDRTHVLNTLNRVLGKKTRRGDGTFGELVPTDNYKLVEGFRVARGPTATLEIGAEAKIICVAQARQIDRVCSDLEKQVRAFEQVSANALSVAVIGVNRADSYRSIEGINGPKSEWKITKTTGKKSRLHPIQEADKTIQTLQNRVASLFDEFLIFEFIATNDGPLEFKWHDEGKVRREYASALTRIARDYARRFADG